MNNKDNPRILAAKIMGMARSDRKTNSGRLNTAKARLALKLKCAIKAAKLNPPNSP